MVLAHRCDSPTLTHNQMSYPPYPRYTFLWATLCLPTTESLYTETTSDPVAHPSTLAMAVQCHHSAMPAGFGEESYNTPSRMARDTGIGPLSQGTTSPEPIGQFDNSNWNSLKLDDFPRTIH